MTFTRHPHAGWLAVGIAAAAAAAAIASDARLLVLALALIVFTAATLVLFEQPRWGLVVLLFGTFTYALDKASPGIPKTFTTTVLVLCAVVAVRALTGIERPPLPERELLLAAAFFTTLAVSSVVASDSGLTWERLELIFPSAVGAFLMALLLGDTVWLRRAMWSVAAAGAFMATLALFQQATGSFSSTFGGLAQIRMDGSLARAGGPFARPNFFAQALLLAGVLALYLSLAARGRRERLLAGVAAALCLAGIGATYSRGAGIALAVVFVLVVALRRPRPALVVGVVAVIVAVGLIALPPTATDRLVALTRATDAPTDATVDTSVRGRFSENLAALKMFEAHPVLGIGAGNYPIRYADYSTYVGIDPRPVREPHNLYFEALAETGIVGGLVLLALLWATASGAWQARRTLEPRAALLAEGTLVALVGVLATSIFLHTGYARFVWLAYGLAWAARVLAARQAASTGSPASEGAS